MKKHKSDSCIDSCHYEITGRLQSCNVAFIFCQWWHGVIEYGHSPSYGPLLNRWLETQSELSSIIAKKDVNSGAINNESFNEISKYCKESSVRQSVEILILICSLLRPYSEPTLSAFWLTI